jgi:hypothetical protein
MRKSERRTIGPPCGGWLLRAPISSWRSLTHGMQVAAIMLPSSASSASTPTKRLSLHVTLGQIDSCRTWRDDGGERGARTPESGVGPFGPLGGAISIGRISAHTYRAQHGRSIARPRENHLPGVAEVAMQSGLHAARTIACRVQGHATRPLRRDGREEGVSAKPDVQLRAAEAQPAGGFGLVPLGFAQHPFNDAALEGPQVGRADR